MTPLRRAALYAAATAGMAALGAAAAATIVALEERTARRLGDGEKAAPRPTQGLFPEIGGPDVLDEASAFLGSCGSCDGGLSLACTCPTGDYRPVMLRLVREVEALRDEWRPVLGGPTEDEDGHDCHQHCPPGYACHGRHGERT